MNIHTLLRQDPALWDLFTRKEEYTSPLRDMYDRFPSYASKNRDIFEPTASRYLVEQGYSPKYPDDAPFAVCLTHDIDEVYQSIPSKAVSALRCLNGGNPQKAIHSVFRMRSKKLPLCNFSAIMDLEEKYGAKSTFFFMVESSDERDYEYTIEDLEPEIGNIIDRGWEVGLHGGHSAYLDPREIRDKKERLEKITHRPVRGYRNHYLRFRIPDTWEYLSQTGFLYDTTVGYADCAGFRNGMCHPYRPFNLNTGREIAVWEIPLILMDNTLGPTHMRLDGKTSWETATMLISRVADCQGVFTLVWHNTYMEGNDHGDDLRLIEKILHYCKNRNAWMTSGEKLMTFWMTHNEC